MGRAAVVWVLLGVQTVGLSVATLIVWPALTRTLSRRLRRCPLARTHQITPAPDQLWLSRPPYVRVAHVRSVDTQARPPRIHYALLDDDGSTLAEVTGELGNTWWATFQPLVRREG